MLGKIISIRNVGRFAAYKAGGDVSLKRYNVIFAENGRGKTTLCAILRSLQTGEADLILGRATLGANGAPEVELLAEEAACTFTNGAWNKSTPHLAIFDSTFVSENIHAGEAVGLNQKRKLYGVIVGSEGVKLARDIERLDSESRTQSAEIRNVEADIKRLAPSGFSVGTFLKLSEVHDVDAAIFNAERHLQSLKEADQIKRHPSLAQLQIPAIPETLAEVLTKTLEGIANDAEVRVAAQIQTHSMHDRGESWLSEGLQYIDNDSCPFCEQPLEGAETLIGAYKAYFSESYHALKGEIERVRGQIESDFGDQHIASIEHVMTQNKNSLEFWARYCDIVPPSGEIDLTTALKTLHTLRQSIFALLDKKRSTPLEKINSDVAFMTSKRAFANLRAQSVAYSEGILAANKIIAAKKDATNAANISDVQNRLALLRASKVRQEPKTKALCLEYDAALSKKKQIDETKADAKRKLDDFTAKVISEYEDTINRLLDYFNAGFQITDTKHGYSGGVASCSYRIVINDTPVALGDDQTPISEPSFRNTLSSGDKSTLALAFFIAQLEHDPERAKKIVVFDDPFNSQDSFRKSCTVRKIRSCGQLCTQVIVLSHDRSFLKQVWAEIGSTGVDRRALEFRRIGLRNTTISEWDIVNATQNQFVTDCNVLQQFYLSGNGDLRQTARAIRPVLETHLRSTRPSEFTADDTLGEMAGKIRRGGPGHPLAELLEGLEDLNIYTRKYAHGQPPAQDDPIDNNELHGFVKKTLGIIGCVQ